jgi:anti-sigma-K factor RskA
VDDCDHRELAAAYALGALDRADVARFEAHLERCAVCEADVEGYRDALLVLAHSADPAEPPPPLRDRILAEVAPPPATARAGRSIGARARWPRVAWGAGLAAAAAVVLVAIVVARGPAPRTPESLLGEPVAAQIALAPAGTGRVYVGRDGRVVAQIDLRRAPAGRVYQAWVMPKGDARTARPAGLVDGGKQTVVLASPAHRGDVVGFTLEPAGGSPRPTTPPVATARV